MNDPAHNPYAPPKAVVAEPIENSPTSAPPPVKTAMKLLWVSMVLTYVEIALDWTGFTTGTTLSIFVIWLAVFSIVQVWIYLKIARGRNWARITWLVLVAITLPMTIIELRESAQRVPVAAGVTLIDLFLVVYSLYLLFLPGRDWFRKRPGQRN